MGAINKQRVMPFCHHLINTFRRAIVFLDVVVHLNEEKNALGSFPQKDKSTHSADCENIGFSKFVFLNTPECYV